MPFEFNDIPIGVLEAAAEKKAKERAAQNLIDTYFQDTGPYRRELYPKQIEFFAAGAKYKERMLMAANRCGKAQPNDEPVLTPTGFVKMGDIRAGDLVIGSDGQPTRVLQTYPQGIRHIYEFTFSDGSSTRCDEGHLWKCRGTSHGRLSKFETITAAEIHRRFLIGKKIAVPTRPIVDFHQQEELPVDPYLVGLLLGDGGLGAGGVVKITTADEFIVDYCRKVAPDYGCVLRGGSGTSLISYWFASIVKIGGRHHNILASLLDALGMGGKTSYFKRIPPQYLVSSLESRIALLCGLMDTDGTCSKASGARQYYSVSRGLCEDVCFLARSLGINASVRIKNGRYKGEAHKSFATALPFTGLSIFSLARKKDLERRPKIAMRALMIESVEKCGEAECTCIVVENTDQLYITKDFIVTHNSDAGSFELTCHLTGVYPHWWAGRRFKLPIDAWACGTNSETTRDIVQAKLLGPVGELGTGFIRADLIDHTTPRRSGIAGSIDTVWVKHIAGGCSRLGLKSYEQGRESFEGTARQVVWNDEEPPEDCYTEMLLRTATTRGIMMTTFTPLNGMSAVVKGFLEPETQESLKYKWYIQAGWKDVPHIPEEEKEALRSTMPPYQLKARTDGEPALGSGAIYPIAEADISCNPFPAGIPELWPRAFAMDVGWQRTAALWGARDPSTGVIYIYSEHYQSQTEPAAQAEAIKSRGAWIPGVIDPASAGSSQIDGRKLIEMYRKFGLKLQPADNAVETGIKEVWGLMCSGKLKIFNTCDNFFREFRKYHRDDKGSGKIVKREDHLVDALRYLITSGRQRMIGPPGRRPIGVAGPRPYPLPGSGDDRSWMI